MTIVEIDSVILFVEGSNSVKLRLSKCEPNRRVELIANHKGSTVHNDVDQSVAAFFTEEDAKTLCKFLVKHGYGE